MKPFHNVSVQILKQTKTKKCPKIEAQTKWDCMNVMEKISLKPFSDPDRPDLSALFR